MINAILAIIIVGLAICGMAIGLILRNKPLSPSCGGVYLSKGETCQVCGKVKDYFSTLYIKERL